MQFQNCANIYETLHFAEHSESYFQGLVCMGHRQDLVSGVEAAQFAEGAEQPLTGPTVELQLLLVVLRTSQNLEAAARRNNNLFKS